MYKLKISIVLILFAKISAAQVMSVSELLVNSTVGIESTRDTIINGKKSSFTSVGTGFFFSYIFGRDTVPCIVTNFHVISNSKVGTLRFTEGDKSPNNSHVITKTLNSFSSLWIKHPTQDLAILPIKGVIAELHKGPFVVTFGESDIPKQDLIDDLTAIEDVLMISCQMDFWDITNNFPVIRKCLTATPLYLNYEGRPQFLLDIPICPCSSGSPVILFNQGSYNSRRVGRTVGSRMALLGIKVQSINTQITGDVNATNAHTTTTKSVPVNIDVVIKSSELLSFKPILSKIIYKN
jgi:hypothetical protein